MFLKWTKRILLPIAALIFIWIIYHNTARYFEAQKLEGPGTYVEVDGEKMHLYETGKGEQTIVLLSGYGTGSPMTDFNPLIRALSDEYRVVVLEYLGYGYSQDTEKPRTIENIVGEIHEGLEKLNVEPPYIFLPHSISGVYTMHYAATYPDEVAAVIGDDCTLPKHLEGISISDNTLKEDIIQYSGAVRLAAAIAPTVITPEIMKINYSDEMIKTMKRLTVRNYHNKALKDEFIRYGENGKKVLAQSIDPGIPMLLLVSETSHNDFESWNADNKATVEAQNVGEIVTFEGEHYLHRTLAEEMAVEIKRFIEEISKK